MIRIYADSKAEPVRCTNRRRGIWRITWDYQETETPEGVQRSYMEETFDHLPALAEIKVVINEWYNRKITDTIESGYVWNGLKVWLSMENQMNYKTAYDLALQTGGARGRRQPDVLRVCKYAATTRVLHRCRETYTGDTKGRLGT